jgi:Icc-related predicted phosphoesterase
MPGFTVYFATDLHGSEQCFRKFLNAGKFYGADAVILGGDVAGKALIPVVSGPGGSFEAHAYGRSYRAGPPRTSCRRCAMTRSSWTARSSR